MCRDVVAGPTRREAAACRLLEHLARWCFQHRCPAPTCHPALRCRNQVYTPAGEVGEVLARLQQGTLDIDLVREGVGV